MSNSPWERKSPAPPFSPQEALEEHLYCMSVVEGRVARFPQRRRVESTEYGIWSFA